MAPRKASPPSLSPIPIPIGNCEVMVEAKGFNCKSDQNSLSIFLSRNAKIRVSVREEVNRKCDNDEKAPKFEDDYGFLLVNPKDGDSFSKSCLQEVLNLYMQELPTMSYAANTGKKSSFLEQCVSNGRKYCTLLLNSKFMECSEKMLAAITYQIVPADTQYAEIPLAAVRSNYQHKGFGCLLYMELRRRLQSVGIHTIYCWGDVESEGFWIKQGFASIANVDKKGRARRLPIKSDIRRTLCFPGGSTLMVAHLNRDTLDNPADSLKFVEQLIQDGLSSRNDKADGFCQTHDAKQGCGDAAPSERVLCNNMATCGEPTNVGSSGGVNLCTCSTQNAKRKVWEASLSSLKSKKVKGSHLLDCSSESAWGLIPESDCTAPCFNGCSWEMVNNSIEGKPFEMTSKALVGKEVCSNGEYLKVMLMNIADDTKKTSLTKVIEMLGGAVTCDGSASTHVVTGKVRKTLNFCTALCSGAWVVSSSWLKESFRVGKFVDELPFILHDEDYMSKYRTDLKSTVLIARSRPRALLRGYHLCIASHVQPPIRTLSAIVRSAGGQIISGLDKVSKSSKTIFIACEEDMEEALSAAKKGIWTFSGDWLMNCIMKQELDLGAPKFSESL
ncbi:uncharacterized protein LOC119995167 isoform X1 [Tripterygium wilfordii]|uniref:uncharacterized protein LOC119995167 isoform X1 n=1 Tax=Tripterygium wilfordii TaxID=458696 RepID=UPI0018F82CBF|nr:uncharacterized protein LOC119995167 isoform X1 [Tripterygium wilfordii]